MASTRDPRFKVTLAQARNRQIPTGIDGQQTLDWELVITTLDRWSVRLDWTMLNRSTEPLRLDQIDILTGKLAGAVEPARNRALAR